uniref:ATP synthase subunit 8 n=1 Tax=Spirobolus grahami TaxID=3065235 RepID=A0AA49Q9T9_9MYRI|nr:ATP synthase F0 subunit 8 [Spirobolus grahami]WKY95848.1 ATP synthase subunit 8 [Spirobolus grahami]
MPQMFPTQWVTLALFFPSMILALTVKISYLFSQPTPPLHCPPPSSPRAWAW